ncbi:flagellar hook-length control protein FliK [Thermoanaerobacter uzonensis DSM 18761]|uniref:Flagellar hook-length control protein FliK n=1 Tax=Thermoanaerobacter uzonensis DSM 18761 TaxID=1123369 RepID=A0A1M4URW7_9THEO|nr:flagellar hook-length control protein FliK [Thermoanaerobacter uzonensis]SHE59456.1 flagellar hook-length control protein FliK [Thermoanaerobacter uzonensis DSM 18761]
MIEVLPDTNLLPFNIQQPRTDRSKTVASFQKDNKLNKFSKMLQQQVAINENKENSTGKEVSDSSVELNSLFSTTQSLKEEKNLKSFQTDDLSLADVFNALQQLISALNVAIQSDDGNQLIEKQNFYVEMQKEVQRLMQDFLNNGVLDVDKLSQKISQLLEEKLGVKLQPDAIATAIKSSNFKEVLKDYKDENVDIKNMNTQKTDSNVFSQHIIKKEVRENLTPLTAKNEDSSVIDNQHIPERNKEDIPKTKDSQTELNNMIKEERNTGKNQQLQQNDFTFLKNDGKTFGNQLINHQNSKLKEVPESQIFDQIVKSINFSKNDMSSTISIQLKPEFLGKLQINLKSIDGNIIATIITDSEKLKHQIESNIGILNTQLDLKGIKIDSFNVTVDKNMQFTSQYNGQQQSYNDNSQEQNLHRAYGGYLHYDLAEAEETETLQRIYNLSQEHIDVRA